MTWINYGVGQGWTVKHGPHQCNPQKNHAFNLPFSSHQRWNDLCPFQQAKWDNKCKTTCMKVTTSLWYKWTQNNLIVNCACAAHVLQVLSRMVLQKLVGAKPFTPTQILWFVNSKGGISLKAAEENKLKSQEVMVPSNCMQTSRKSWRQLLKSSECGWSAEVYLLRVQSGNEPQFTVASMGKLWSTTDSLVTALREEALRQLRKSNECANGSPSQGFFRWWTLPRPKNDIAFLGS